MKRFKINAIYHASVELEVDVADDCPDPNNPEHWKEIVSEHQTDFHLYDTEGEPEEIER